MTFAVILWVILAIVFIIIEIQTISLVTIWFGIGAVLAAIAAGYGAIVWLQIVIFIVTSMAVLLILRPYIVKGSSKGIPVNADRNIGKQGTIITPATEHKMGQIRIGGQVWSYRAEDNKNFEINEKAVVLRIEGVKVIVDKVAE